MGMKCPACGSMVIYDIEKSKLKCVSCSSTFDVEQYDIDNSAEKTEGSSLSMNMDAYLCKNCGAELDVPEEQTVAYCMYCGGETSLMQKSQPMERPQKIIPFKYSKKDVRKRFEEELNGKLFVPSEFQKAEFIEGFRGIYIPYWSTNAKLTDKRIDVEGIHSTSQGDYTITSYYDLKIDVGGKIDAGSFDASELFDDTIAAEIAPFKYEDCKPFKEGYLAGFYSDKATASIDLYEELIADTICTNLQEEIKAEARKAEVKKADLKKTIEYELEPPQLNLFPVWFLTWKKGNRVAYSVMNGQTGKMATDIPVDSGKLFRSFGIMTAIIFVILCIVPTFILPTQMAMVSSILLYISSLVLSGQLKQIKIRENHVYDWGNTKYHAKKKKLKDKKEENSKDPGCLGTVMTGFLWFLAIVVIVVLMTCIDTATVEDVDIIFGMMFFVQIIVAIYQFIHIFGIKNKFAIVPVLLSLAIQLSGVFVADITRQNDSWYYGLAMAVLLGMMINLLVCVKYMNYLTTRPAPNFFTRKGADQNA